jgi:hypothetical protein
MSQGYTFWGNPISSRGGVYMYSGEID